MKKKYYNEITRFFDDYKSEDRELAKYFKSAIPRHYICYDDSDIENKELYIKFKEMTVGSVILNNSNKIFAVFVRTNLVIKYTDKFEKAVSDKYMDLPYDFSKDELIE